MIRRRRVAGEHPVLAGLTEQYAEVLRLRQQILLAETDQDAAGLPSDLRQVAGSGTDRIAGKPCARSASDSHPEPIE